MNPAARWVPWALVGAAVVVAVLAAQPGRAAAHTRTEETTNVDSRIVSVPDLPGVTWTVHTGGLLVEVDNPGDGVLVVEGYEGEPYLRIGPDGVELNRLSPATYLNSDRYADVTVPPHVDPEAPADWVHVEDRPRYAWHDHRTHWMSPRPPPFVDASPGAGLLMDMELVGPIGRAGDDEGVFGSWSIAFSHDGRAHEVVGEMSWQDPPSVLPWVLLAMALVSPALLGLRASDVADVVRPAAVVVGLVAVVNGIHLVDDLVSWPSDPLDEIFGVLHTSLFLAGGLGGALWALKTPWGRALALGVASGSLLYHQGIVQLPMLFASQFPTVWPDGLVRATIALGAVQAVPVSFVVARAARLGAARGEDQPGACRRTIVAP